MKHHKTNLGQTPRSDFASHHIYRITLGTKAAVHSDAARKLTSFFQECAGPTILRIVNVFPYDEDYVEILKTMIESFTEQEFSWKGMTFEFEPGDSRQLIAILTACIYYEWSFDLFTPNGECFLDWSNESIGELYLRDSNVNLDCLSATDALTVKKLDKL